MLDDRKLNILYSIILSYIESAEPIGSRTISKQFDLGVSSATIRNEMSDLEDLGYLNKAHASSGRIPSDKAYRFYVDELLKKYHQDLISRKLPIFDELKSREYYEPESLIGDSTKFLSKRTNYTALAMITNNPKAVVTKMQLLSIDLHNLVLVWVYDTKNVRHATLAFERAYDETAVQWLNAFLHRVVVGLDLKEIPKKLTQEAQLEPFPYPEFISTLEYILSKELIRMRDVLVITDGVSNIFNYPEYKDIERAREFIALVENKDALFQIFRAMEHGEIDVRIGEENAQDVLLGSTIISKIYSIGDNTTTTIGVIGPKRMNYGSSIEAIISVVHTIDQILKDKDKGANQ